MSPEVKTKPPPEVKAEAKPEAKLAASQATFSNPNSDGVPWPQTWKLIASRFLALSDKAVAHDAAHPEDRHFGAPSLRRGGARACAGACYSIWRSRLLNG